MVLSRSNRRSYLQMPERRVQVQLKILELTSQHVDGSVFTEVQSDWHGVQGGDHCLGSCQISSCECSGRLLTAVQSQRETRVRSANLCWNHSGNIQVQTNNFRKPSTINRCSEVMDAATLA